MRTLHLQAVDKSLQEVVALDSSQATPLLSEPWGLHYIAHTSSQTLLTTSKALFEAVYAWKCTNALAEAAGMVQTSSGNRTRPVLMARAFNHQDSRQQQQQRKEGPSSGGTASSSGSGSKAAAAMTATVQTCAKTAKLLSRCDSRRDT